MNKPRSISRRRLRPLVLLGLLAMLLGVLAPPRAALAHAADVYLQATYITVAASQIVVELNLSPGVLVAPESLAEFDRDGDQQISDAEGQTYVPTVLQHLVLEVDGALLSLRLRRSRMSAPR